MRATSMVSCSFLLPFLLSLPIAPGASAEEKPLATAKVDLSPARWADGEFEKYRAIDTDYMAAAKLAEGGKAMIVTTSSGGTAVRAGLEALRQGGSAVDAALTTALTQITLVMGSWTSYAGILTLTIYDAESGQVYCLDAPWVVPIGETDPLSIPSASDGSNGRAVLVPGFMAGAQAAHDRFGVLPWEQLFTPAIYLAEEGFELTQLHQWLINFRREALQRHPESWALFSKDASKNDSAGGEPMVAGDRLRQPALARTLRGVAEQGADYMYRGSWAEKLVTAVRAEGGQLSPRDMKAYRPIWIEPISATFGDRRVIGAGLPAGGGIGAVEAFRLLELANLKFGRHYSQDAETLFWLLQIARVGPLLSIAPVRTGYDPARLFGELDVSPFGRTDPRTTREIWRRLGKPDWSRAMRSALTSPGGIAPLAGSHSDAVVAMDERGNVVALTHSINTNVWGSLGLFIDGVGIADPAANQQGFVARAGAGRHLPNGMNPLLVLKDGKPEMASAAVGNGLHEITFQNLVNMMVYDMDPKSAIEAPKFLAPYYDPLAKENLEYYKQRIQEGSFDPKIVDALVELGQEIALQKAEDLKGMGYWVGLKIDPETGIVQGGAGRGDSYAEGY